MVLVDFPHAKPQNGFTKKANKDFPGEKFQALVALTPDGKEIGRPVGYLSGGPQAFIAELDKFRQP